TRASFSRVKPKSITMEFPPLLLRLPPKQVAVEGREYPLTVVARVYDIGAVSIGFVLEDPEGQSLTLQNLALYFAGQKGLDPLFTTSLHDIRDILQPHIQNLFMDPAFFEDYTILITESIDDAVDPVTLLLGENRTFSPQTRADVLKHSLSYGVDDLAILTWDTALLISKEPVGDLIELIEFANVQSLELRYYDKVLTSQMERMYDDIELADRSSRWRRLRQYHSIMSRLMEDQAEISEITEKVDNLIKITEDIFYARVYSAALDVLRISQWRSSVSRKIGVIRENYRMLSDEVNIQYSHFLERVIIVLIALEIAFVVGEAIGPLILG
ncbi:MAG TPA: hypothetical protein VE134_03970, partial [Methanomicrobiales archaeon]|nr:hypothetical protein [Methanomicrobiales archaeon]